MAQSARLIRSPMGKTEQNTGAPATGGPMADAASTPSAVRQGDVLSLSNVTQRIKDEPGFNRAKVDSIKQAIQEGQYPLNPRRIAESFVALERMFSD